jgi:hypothetical protein
VEDAARTVFLSYRRDVSWAMAYLVRDDLQHHGFDVFMDTQDLDSGEFERVILSQIESRTHFLVLLQVGTLDRVDEQGDWLRREIAHALRCHRNIVPLMTQGFRLPRSLPADIAQMAGFNAVSVPPDYFDAAMQKLRERFLRAAVPRPGTPPPVAVDPPVADAGAPPARSQPTTISFRPFGAEGVSVGWEAAPDAIGYVLEAGRGDRTSVIYRGRALVLHRLSGRGDTYPVRAEFRDGTFGPWSADARWRPDGDGAQPTPQS